MDRRTIVVGSITGSTIGWHCPLPRTAPAEPRLQGTTIGQRLPLSFSRWVGRSEGVRQKGVVRHVRSQGLNGVC